MTYPPQQPDPGGWDQQAAGNPGTEQGPAGAPQQQPAWYGNQHTGWGQQQPPGPPGRFQPGQPPPPGQPHPGQPPFAPQPGQQAPEAAQFPPPPDWGGGEFGQNSWVQEPGGFAAVEPPREKKSRLPWVLGIIGVLVLIGGIGGGVYFFSGGPGEARTVAQNLVDKVNANDFDGLGAHLCQSNRDDLEGELEMLEPGEFELRLGRVSEDGEKASAQLLGSYEMDGVTRQVDQMMGLEVEAGSWKICDLDQ
ncbi:Rv0361 family membrane protein [Parasphingorhabdus pacifica]